MLELGSWPDWIQAIGTLLALVFAAVAAKAAINTNRQQAVELESLRRQESERESQLRRDQAAQVGIWLQPHTAEFPDVYFFNASRLPVYDTKVVVTCRGHGRSRRYAVRIPSVEPMHLQLMTQELHAVIGDAGMEVEEQFELIAQNMLTISMSFLDSQGVWWTRTNKGVLAERRDQADAERHLGQT